MKKSTIIAFIAFMLVLFGLASLTGDDDNYTCTDKTIIVAYGDTLWSIAEEHCTGNLQVAVDDLVNRYDTNLQVGDIVTLGTGDQP